MEKHGNRPATSSMLYAQPEPEKLSPAEAAFEVLG
jgi:hypothetical protein